jgi:hypothetical protein
MARRYKTRAEALDEALRIIMSMPHEAADQEGFIRITSDPTKEVAKKMGYATGGARGVIRDLKDKGIIKFISMGGEKRADGHKGHAWLVKLPEDDGGSAALPPEEQIELELDEDHPPEVVALEKAFRGFAKAYANIHAILQAYPQVVRERDEAQRELRELREALASLANGKGDSPTNGD